MVTYKHASAVIAAIGVTAAGMYASFAMAGGNPGGGHTPVTICHKPGTPAEHTIVVDDDSVELTGHLGHGDTRGPCPGDTTPTDTTPTETTPTETTPTETTPTETTPTEPTPTTPPEPPHVVTGTASVYCDLPSQTYIVTGTIDGQAADSVSPPTIPGSYHGWTNVTVHRGDTDFRTAVFTYGDCVKPTGSNLTTQSTTTGSGTSSATGTEDGEPDGTSNPKSRGGGSPRPSSTTPKLTGDPKKDKCKPVGDGTLNCKGVIVVPGNG